MSMIIIQFVLVWVRLKEWDKVLLKLVFQAEIGFDPDDPSTW